MGRRPPAEHAKLRVADDAKAKAKAPDEAAQSDPAHNDLARSESAQQQAASKASRPDASASQNRSADPFVTSQATESPAASTQPGQNDLPIGDAPSPQALLAEWYQRYGNAFFKGHTRPLKVGIHEELSALEPWPEKLVKRALACYVNLPRYLKAVREGAERIDLQGKPAGSVDSKAAEHARKKLDRLQSERRKPGTGHKPIGQKSGGQKPGSGPQANPGPAKNQPRKSGPSKQEPVMQEPAPASDITSQGGAHQATPATLEEKLSALLAKHNQQ
ncbi:ABC transporter substrate-binding protein [Halomonas urumqiensis]|uniref:ABC transporter substrate-binding protein n=2 Tax=Halomonas urumqiensis TaxID=1684789 RepID=A0A2N7UDY7_9GAMM|nr:ABC transporter substrate-binding protein [Halomonas urumqiensis]PTB04282.1 ABC transporter substrate-binding protein [Halomonas urumqiensis]